MFWFQFYSNVCIVFVLKKILVSKSCK
jgi:hypothetical protein